MLAAPWPQVVLNSHPSAPRMRWIMEVSELRTNEGVVVFILLKNGWKFKMVCSSFFFLIVFAYWLAWKSNNVALIFSPANISLPLCTSPMPVRDGWREQSTTSATVALWHPCPIPTECDALNPSLHLWFPKGVAPAGQQYQDYLALLRNTNF